MKLKAVFSSTYLNARSQRWNNEDQRGRMFFLPERFRWNSNNPFAIPSITEIAVRKNCSFCCTQRPSDLADEIVAARAPHVSYDPEPLIIAWKQNISLEHFLIYCNSILKIATVHGPVRARISLSSAVPGCTVLYLELVLRTELQEGHCHRSLGLPDAWAPHHKRMGPHWSMPGVHRNDCLCMRRGLFGWFRSMRVPSLALKG